MERIIGIYQSTPLAWLRDIQDNMKNFACVDQPEDSLPSSTSPDDEGYTRGAAMSKALEPKLMGYRTLSALLFRCNIDPCSVSRLARRRQYRRQCAERGSRRKPVAQIHGHDPGAPLLDYPLLRTTD